MNVDFGCAKLRAKVANFGKVERWTYVLGAAHLENLASTRGVTANEDVVRGRLFRAGDQVVDVVHISIPARAAPEAELCLCVSGFDNVDRVSRDDGQSRGCTRQQTAPGDEFRKLNDDCTHHSTTRTG